MNFTIHEILYMAACFAFILSGIICGVIRWFHLCRPYDRQADYFYPARKGAFLIFSGLILLLPYLLKVSDDDTWLYARSFGILYYPAIYSWLILRYFKGSLRYVKSLRHVLFEVPTMLLMVYMFLGTTSLYHTADVQPVVYIVGGWGIVLFVYMLNVIFWLKKQIDNYHYERYSNSEDFPYRFAERVLFTPLAILALMWLIFITDSRNVKMYVDWFMTIYNVVFLCVILHPQRQLLEDERNNVLEKIEAAEMQRVQEEIEEENRYDVEHEETDAVCNDSETEMLNSDNQGAEDVDKRNKLTDEQLKYYQDLVIRELRDKRAFLDNHYTLAKLSQSIHIGRTYTSLVCASLGGFYNLVNKYRCDYALQYQAKYPNATQDTVSIESGFKDRKAYHRAKTMQALENSTE